MLPANISALAQQAYSDYPAAVQEDLAVEALLPNQVQQQVWLLTPHNVKQMLVEAERVEVILSSASQEGTSTCSKRWQRLPDGADQEA